MAAKSPRAFAHKFIVISATPHFTDYVGTKEELISLGLALDHHFPVARKRVVYTSDLPDNLRPLYYFRTARIKGGRFELRIWNERQAPKKTPPILSKFEIEYAPEEGTDPSCVSNYVWRMWGDPAFKKWAEEEINYASVHIINTIKSAHSRYRKNPSYLKLVEPMTATGGK
ncbi:hypothetical protein SAMN05216412_101344 [Nitrosospira multiformis]|uniref:Uncharacterized protein n=1 Tax=Nitrosospira multiformis TaxID=1231 RepID=A0A1H9YR74_9PROT|nr:hypothetical protein [Nitrosospira multiformis]SES71575.1 hypothetical protein SAMN05216412_101344 [Nitrosospira multiformis]